MYFKGIEIIGFKSFMNKTKLKFEPGVTAIVGPNGCGKSNVVDAIKWVLGEQSTKAMRSDSMQDVIFNGTEKHDPVNVAEVSLILSNEDRTLPVDYDEVIISRRLYRSGESEYLLNKTPVRLSDVRDLLMGTGMGTSSYSVVEQGKMDMILSSKPEERRHIFEEASGITRYKTRKREALLKLERTQENLVRINDIIREVERQIGSIERQARKAERYKARYEELKDLEIKAACEKFRNISEDDTSAGEAGSELKTLTERLVSGLHGASDSLKGLRSEFGTVLGALQDLQNEVTRIRSDIDKNRHVSSINAERIEELQKDVEMLDREIEETTERREELAARLEGLEVRFSDIKKRREDKGAAMASVEEEARNITEKLGRYQHELKLGRERTVDMLTEQTKTRNTAIKLDADIQNARFREKRLRAECDGVRAEKAKVEEGLKRAVERAASSAADLENKKAEFRTFNDEYVSRQQKLSLISAEKRDREKALNEIRPRRMFFEKLIAEREGINESVKAIMEQAEKGDPVFAGVHGILTELVNVNDAYEESMESVLGDMAQSIVVDSRAAAERITGYLGGHSMGSVNFIIMEEIRKAMEEGPERHVPDASLNDITRVLLAEEPYLSSLGFLLKDCFTASSPEAAAAFMDGGNYFSGRIVGEKGEISQKGMRRSRNFSDKEVIPLFGRREKVDQMKQEEERISGEIGKIDAEISELEKWLRESAARKERLESELREKQAELADALSKKAVIEEKLSSAEDEIRILMSEIEEEAGAIKKMQENKERFDRALEELDARSRKVQRVIEEAQGIIQECAGEREGVLFRMANIRAELSVISKEEENLSENVERDRFSCRHIERQVEEKRARISEDGARIRSLKEEITALERRDLENAAALEGRMREISENTERKEALEQAMRREEEKVTALELELEDARNRTRDIDIRKKEIEYKRSALAEKMFDLYKVDIRGLDMDPGEDTDWDEVSGRIEGLKEQLEKMGEVSLGAVEEHKQLEERYQFLSRQRDDLVRGREDVMQAITKINRTTRSMFMETFEAIRKEFNYYFRMLFNGGKAELVLADESDVLECGIDIVVRPPGKKLHNIMQLSGGEKSMTAVALIFAIFKVNPSPFCILDEIDAPLDESNIVRFCRVLQEFLKLSQFIIVTHNRMTIQLADVLYGITMEEKGVSKVVSVKFSEDKEAPEVETAAIAA